MALLSDVSVMNLDMTVQTEVKSVSGLGPHVEMSQSRIEKIRFHVICVT